MYTRLSHYRLWVMSVALIVALVAMSPAAVFARGVAVGANLNVNLDVLGIADRIKSDVNAARDREGFVKNLMESTYYALGQRYNVMVFNLNQNYEDRFSGVKFYGSAVYHGITYGIWAFENGAFLNKGDGGYINWAFRGNFHRDGNYVAFNR